MASRSPCGKPTMSLAPSDATAPTLQLVYEPIMVGDVEVPNRIVRTAHFTEDVDDRRTQRRPRRVPRRPGQGRRRALDPRGDGRPPVEHPRRDDLRSRCGRVVPASRASRRTARHEGLRPAVARWAPLRRRRPAGAERVGHAEPCQRGSTGTPVRRRHRRDHGGLRHWCRPGHRGRAARHRGPWWSQLPVPPVPVAAHEPPGRRLRRIARQPHALPGRGASCRACGDRRRPTGRRTAQRRSGPRRSRRGGGRRRRPAAADLRLIDFLDASIGTYYATHWTIGAMDRPTGYQLPSSGRITAAVPEVPRIVAGRFRTLADAEAVLRSGQADLVSMVRAHIADPDIVRKTRAGRADEVRPCIGCNQGCLGPHRGRRPPARVRREPGDRARGLAERGPDRPDRTTSPRRGRRRRPRGAGGSAGPPPSGATT